MAALKTPKAPPIHQALVLIVLEYSSFIWEPKQAVD